MHNIVAAICIQGEIGIIRIPGRNLNSTFGHAHH